MTADMILFLLLVGFSTFAQSIFSQTCMHLSASRENSRLIQAKGTDDFPVERCWVITADNKDDTVQINLENFQVDRDIGKSQPCGVNFLQIRDGAASNSTLLHTWCGTLRQTSVRSRGTSLHLTLVSNNASDGLSLTYISVPYGLRPCLRLAARSTVQTVTSQGYPDAYEPDTNQCWQIDANGARYLLIYLEDLRLESAERCPYDHLSIYDANPDERNALFARKCNYWHSKFWILRTGSAFIQFITNNRNQGSGFKLHFYSFPEPGRCKQLSAGSSAAILTSPGYPVIYPINGMEWCWKITAPSPNDRINIHVTDFKIVPASITHDKNCSMAHLEIRDGDSADSPLIKKICGYTFSVSMTSTNDSLYVRFASRPISNVSNSFSAATSSAGFRILYHTQRPSNTSFCNHVNATSVAQNLTSPGFPEEYSTNQTACWIISAQETDMVVRLTVEESELEDSLACTNDFVEVTDGVVPSDARLLRWCGYTKPENITSTGGSILIYFSSNQMIQKRGFRLHYFTVHKDSVRKPAPVTDPQHAFVFTIFFIVIITVVLSVLVLAKALTYWHAKKSDHKEKEEEYDVQTLGKTIIMVR